MKQTPTNTCSEISIHALLAESDRGYKVPPARDTTFLSTLSLRRATREVFNAVAVSIISIHALLAESDLFRVAVPEHIIMISIHALLAESDTPRLSRVVPTPIFLSTLSLRRATSYSQHVTRPSGYFYPRSPCGERPHDAKGPGCVFHFYPRSPCGERLFKGDQGHISGDISIHALLAESDACMILMPRCFEYFYPRSPCGERLNGRVCAVFPRLFLSTLSLRRATLDAPEPSRHFAYFYPRSPCGERLGEGD